MPSSTRRPSGRETEILASSEAISETLVGYQVSTSEDSTNDTLSIASNRTKIHWQTPSKTSEGKSTHQESVGRNSVADSQPDTEPAGETETPNRTASHSRRDLISGDWVIFAPERNQRPNDFSAVENLLAQSSATKRSSGDCLTDPNCPFCSGAEQETPEAVWSAKLDHTVSHSENKSTRIAGSFVNLVEGEQEGWDVRVVPNKFPAVSPFHSFPAESTEQNAFFPVSDVAGGHEVIIESSGHAETVTQMNVSMAYLSLIAIRDRIQHWRNTPGINFISVFKNCGPDAGASLRHSHCQVVATSLMPHRVRTSLQRLETHRARTGCSLGCDLLRQELKDGSRIIDRKDSFVAFCPFASRFPGLIRITSMTHQPHFDDFGDVALDRLATFLWRALRWVELAHPGKAYNYILQTCPPGARSAGAFQWSLDLFPRISKAAGFEWSSDCMINATLPEASAANYRQVAAMDDPRNVLSNL